MPRTIYSTTGAFPVALEGTKTVKTFPSGLVLVTQEYAVPRGQEADYATMFAVGQPLEVDSPAIDGLYIFPEPEWTDSGDGFTRLTVSAYGRWNQTGQKTLSKTLRELVGRYAKTDERPPAIFQTFTDTTIPTINDQLIWQFVMPKTAAPNVTISEALKIYQPNGTNRNPLFLNEFFDRTGYNTLGPSIIVPNDLPVIVAPTLSRAENTNFGAWDEWTVVWDALPELPIIDFGRFRKILPPIAADIDKDVSIGPINGGFLDNFTISLSDSQEYNNGNAHFVVIDKVENIQRGDGFWTNETPKNNVPSSVDFPSFRGGVVKWFPNANLEFRYAPPTVIRPTGFPSGSNSEYTSNGFTWKSKNLGNGVYAWAFEISYEIFEFTLKNELGQTDKAVLTIRFNDPEYPGEE